MGIYDQSEVCYSYSENSAIAVVPASFTLVLEKLFNPAGYTVENIEHEIEAVNNGTNFGIFVFSANLLAKKDIFSKSRKGGKRGIRVYAPWTTPTAAQAKRTKKWQTENFLNFNNCEDILNSFIRMFS